MIIASSLQFILAIIINFNGIDDDVIFSIKTLCIFLDWAYVLIVIPMSVPFVNNTISAARTASQISVHQDQQPNALSLTPHPSTTDSVETEQRIATSLTCLQRLMACMTL